MSLTKEDLKNISELFSVHIQKIEKRLEKLEKNGGLYELSFRNIDRKLESIERNLLELRARENLNRDRLDRAEIYIDDLRRLFIDSYPKVCEKENVHEKTKK